MLCRVPIICLTLVKQRPDAHSSQCSGVSAHQSKELERWDRSIPVSTQRQNPTAQLSNPVEYPRWFPQRKLNFQFTFVIQSAEFSVTESGSKTV